MKRFGGVLAVVAVYAVLQPEPLPAQACDGPQLHGPESPVSAEALGALAKAVEGYVEDGQVVGAELLVWQRGQVLLDRGFGWKDRERRVAMEPGTVFNIRSMTKTMVGLVAQMLVDEGRLSLDDEVADFLPGFDHTGVDEITIDQLLTHRAGLPLSIVKAVDEFPTLRDMANAVGKAGPRFPPGSRFWYSDAGADALGAVVEAVEGKPLSEVLDERLIGPLGLKGTFPGSSDDDPGWSRVAPLYARANGEWIRAWGPESGAFYPFVWGSQGMMSTPEDFVRVIDVMIRDGSCGDTRLLSPRAVASMEEPVSRMTSLGSDAPEPTNFTGLQARYGRFLEVRTAWPAPAGAGAGIVGHSGSDGTVVYAWPDRELAIAYFTQSRGNPTHLRLERAIDRLILHPGRVAEGIPRSEVEGLPGRYRADFGRFAGQQIGVLVQDGELALALPSGVVSELGRADGEGWRKVVLAPSVVVAFDVGDGGVGRAMRWRDPSGEHLLPRVDASAEEERGSSPDGPDLSEYVGWYRLAGQPDIELVRSGSDLAVVLPGAPAPLPFGPPDAEGFWALRANPAMRIRFGRDEAGKVVSYAAVAPDGSRSLRIKLSGRDPGL